MGKLMSAEKNYKQSKTMKTRNSSQGKWGNKRTQQKLGSVNIAEGKNCSVWNTEGVGVGITKSPKEEIKRAATVDDKWEGGLRLHRARHQVDDTSIQPHDGHLGILFRSWFQHKGENLPCRLKKHHCRRNQVWILKVLWAICWEPVFCSR